MSTQSWVIPVDSSPVWSTVVFTDPKPYFYRNGVFIESTDYIWMGNRGQVSVNLADVK